MRGSAAGVGAATGRGAVRALASVTAATVRTSALIMGLMVEQLPLDVIARLRAIDPAVSPEQARASWELLTPFHERAGYTAPRIDRDLSYGEHPRHRLDVHTSGSPAPWTASAVR
jgi:hypothetical protein